MKTQKCENGFLKEGNHLLTAAEQEASAEGRDAPRPRALAHIYCYTFSQRSLVGIPGSQIDQIIYVTSPIKVALDCELEPINH